MNNCRKDLAPRQEKTYEKNKTTHKTVDKGRLS